MSVQAKESDVELLHRMGYAQELRRRMSTFSNFAVSFTIISILSGCLTALLHRHEQRRPGGHNPGLAVGGDHGHARRPRHGRGVLELSHRRRPVLLGGQAWRQERRGWSWFTGWFNLLGQVAVTAGIDFGLAFFATFLLNALFNYPTTPIWIILIYAVVLFLHGLLNTFGVGLVALLNDISVWWHLVGVPIIVVVLFFVPSHHQSVSFVFTKFVNNTGFNFAARRSMSF